MSELDKRDKAFITAATAITIAGAAGVIKIMRPHSVIPELHMPSLPTAQARDVSVYNPVIPRHTKMPLENFPTVNPSPRDLENVATAYLVPMDELPFVLDIDVPTFPEGYEAYDNAEVTQLSQTSLLVDMRATNQYDDVLSVYVTDTAIEPSGLSHIENINGIDVVIMTQEDGSIHFQWQVGASHYYLSGPNYADMLNTLESMDAFQGRKQKSK